MSACILDIESIVKGCGIEHVTKIKPYNVRSTLAALEEAKGKIGVRVIIAEEPCVLYARRTLKKKRNQVAYVATQGEGAKKTAETLSCPAFSREKDNVVVDESLCASCIVCMQISTDFKARKNEAS
jgi:indolepyruvate ferredoxin oxidoreductase alpha subunit